MNYFSQPDVQIALNERWRQQHMAARQPAQAPSRTVPRRSIVHIRGENDAALCGVAGNAITCIASAKQLTENQQLCGTCKSIDDGHMSTPTSTKRGARVTPPPATVAVKSFRQQQAEDLAAAAQKRRTNGSVPPPLQPGPGVTQRKRGVTREPVVPQPAVAKQTKRERYTSSPKSVSPPTGTTRIPTRIVETRVTGKRNTTTVAEAMIRAGKTNAEVWEVISVEFNLDEGKKGYPSWYRSRMRRNGEDV